jgi:hypothetical protein
MQRGVQPLRGIFQQANKSLRFKMQLGVKSRIFAGIFLLHNAAERFDSPLQDAAES